MKVDDKRDIKQPYIFLKWLACHPGSARIVITLKCRVPINSLCQLGPNPPVYILSKRPLTIRFGCLIWGLLRLEEC